MARLRLIRIVLGILSLIVWGLYVYFAISEAQTELPTYGFVFAVIGICLLLFIPILLLLSEGFWFWHVGPFTVIGWIWGLLAIVSGVVLLFYPLLLQTIKPEEHSQLSVGHIILLILTALLLWADAALIFTRVFRKR